MKKVFLLITLFLTAAFSPAHAQTRPDTSAITNTALDYLEGWYDGNAKRMERALHPKLAKRLVAENPENGQAYLVQTSALELVQQTRRGGGGNIPEAERRTEVAILDIYGNAASVRVDAGGWVDYMHMGKWNGEWKIVNVFWELNPNR